ncbi:MAG: hypothetical protein ABFD94_02885, partial [Armatimonadia bacterium]
MDMQETPRHGLRRALVRLLKAVAAFLVLVVVVNGAFYGYYSWQVGKRVAALRRAGEPVYLEEVKVPEVAEEENAWGDYVRLFHITGDPTTPGARAHGLGEMSERQYEALTGYETSDAELRKLLHEPGVRKTVAALNAASRKPQMVMPLPTRDRLLAEFGDWRSFRDCARICRSLTYAAAVEGNMSQAGELLLTNLCISGQVTQGPTVYAETVASAMYSTALASAEGILAVGPIPAAQSQQLQRELQRQQSQFAKAARQSLVIQRAGEMSLYRRLQWCPGIASDYAFGCPMFDKDAVDRLRSNLAAMPPYWLRQRMIALDLFQRQIQLAQAPAQHLPELEALCASADSSSIDMAVANGAFAFVLLRVPLQQMRMNQFSVALALNDYFRERGRYPERLGELPQPLPGDVLSGEAFRYRRVGGMYLLYGVGADRRDDGGKGRKPMLAD